MRKFKITEKGINFLLIFILGFLVGVALKSEAQKRITIGFNDYLVPKYKQDIKIMEPAQSQDQNENPVENEDQGTGQNVPQPSPGETNQ